MNHSQDLSPLSESDPTRNFDPNAERPTASLPSLPALPQRPEREGVTIGPYRLLQKLGEGGMGAVWVADQSEPVRRRVAIKLIKSGMESEQIIARFEAERQALALMDHPSIAKILDAGSTPDGRPYFVMELVKGMPITRFCDESKLSIQDRLRLFSEVCSAVQHAHNKGIIHRDIKPSNIIVGLIDGKPVPKVIDFGVAKALHHKLGDKTMFTEIGQVIGTLEYMAPEQAELSTLDIDTRADIYALGVVLYELLAGSTPITRERLRKAGIAEVVRVIKEEDAPRPSTRLTNSTESINAVASARSIEPSRLTKMLQGELDWIVMRSLEKDRSRRYETANAFRRDIERYIADEPVEARPASASYRIGKFCRRNKAVVIATGFVMASLMIGIVGTTISMLKAYASEARAMEEKKKAENARNAETKQRIRAYENFVTAREAVDRYFSIVTENEGLKSNDFAPLRAELLQSALPFYDRILKENIADDESKISRGMAFNRMGAILFDLQKFDDALKSFDNSILAWKALTKAEPMYAPYFQELAHAYNGRGRVYNVLGKMKESLEEFLIARDLARKMVKLDPTVSYYSKLESLLSDNIGVLRSILGNDRSAIEDFESAIVIRKELLEKSKGNDTASVLTELGTAQNGLANSYLGLRELEKADAAVQEAIRSLEQADQQEPNKPRLQQILARTLQTQANILEQMGKPLDAKLATERAIVHRQRLAERFPSEPAYRDELQLSFRQAWNFSNKLGEKNSRIFLDKAQSLIDQLLAENPNLGTYISAKAQLNANYAIEAYSGGNVNLAITHQSETVRLLRQVLEMESAVPERKSELARGLNNLGVLLGENGNVDKSIEIYTQALSLRKELAHDYPNIMSYRIEVSQSLNSLGFANRQLGRFDESRRLLEEAAKDRDAIAAELPQMSTRSEQCLALLTLARTMAEQGELAKARSTVQRAIELRRKLVDEFPQTIANKIDLAGDHTVLGQLCLAARDEQECLTQCLVVKEILKPIIDSDVSYLSLAMNRIELIRTEAQALYWLGRHEEALDVLKRAWNDKGNDTNMIGWLYAGFLARSHRLEDAKLVLVALDSTNLKGSLAVQAMLTWADFSIATSVESEQVDYRRKALETLTQLRIHDFVELYHERRRLLEDPSLTSLRESQAFPLLEKELRVMIKP